MDELSDAHSPGELLRGLVALGVDEPTARRAVAEGRVALALVEQLLERDRRYDIRELAARSGIDGEVYRLWERGLGLRTRERFGDADVEHAKVLAAFVRAVPEPDVRGIIRALRGDGQILSRLAMGNLELIREQMVTPLREEGAGDIAVALALADAAHSTLPLAGALVGGAYRRVLEDLLAGELVAAGTRSETDELDLAIGFVDLTGFTSLSARVDPAGLDEVLEAFETRCYTVAGLHPEIQLVKFIGDAAMFVSTSAVALARSLLDVVEPVVDDDSPLSGVAMRAGLSAGPVLPRGGDYYGAPVNLAARLTDRARDDTLLADERLKEDLAEPFRIRRLPPMRLHGLGRHRPLRVRPPKEDVTS